MKTRRSILISAATLPTSSFALPFLSAKVGVQTEFFDPQYYANMNSDLLVANLLTYTQLRSHWNRSGKIEGRTSHPSIDPRAYLARYADLRAAFGATGYVAAYNHYVTNGQYEGRNARNADLLTARLGDVSISASGRCVGAIDSLFFQGRETVNSFDHGRQIQTALYDRYLDACFNPTQAGRKADGRGYASSSQLLSAQQLGAGGFRTKTHCAYWVGPGERINDPGVVPCTANLTSVLSGFTADTTYLLEQSANVTLIRVRTEWVGDRAFQPGAAQVIPVTGYHLSDFSLGFEVFKENSNNTYPARQRQVGDHLGNTGEERPYPVILSTADGVQAIGAVGLPVAGAATTYALYRWKYGQNQQVNDSSSWAIVNRYSDFIPAGTPMVSHSVIALGQVTDVHLEIARIMRSVT